jgi:hypothetical protein
MRKLSIMGLLGALVLAGCGSSPTTFQVEAGMGPETPADLPSTSDGPDAGCDEDAMGADYCIRNPPGPPRGGGTPVIRLPPPAYKTCKP